MDDEHDGQMSHQEFIRANFFSSDADFAAATPQAELTPEAEFEALGAFVRALDTMPAPARKAAIAWLADRYLGVRIR